MPFDTATRTAILRENATDWLNLAVENIEREYPVMPWFVVEGPGIVPSHRELHPAFYGSFDWHSCVEMYWVAVRLMRLCPGSAAEPTVRETISRLLTPEHIATEIAFFRNPSYRGFERPYGWGWLLALQADLEALNDADGQRWAGILRPLADTLSQRLIAWLPLLTYPQRVGVHQNTAFALSRSFDFAASRAEEGDSALMEAVTTAAERMFRIDTNYPAHYEPSGSDFLSAALCEAELMALLTPTDAFADWLTAFLPGLAESQPVQLFTPATVSDGTDGHLAHLAGLNLSRAAGFLTIAAHLPDADPRLPALSAAAERHTHASLASVSGSDYMLEHWLSAYATLLLTV